MMLAKRFSGIATAFVLLAIAGIARAGVPSESRTELPLPATSVFKADFVSPVLGPGTSDVELVSSSAGQRSPATLYLLDDATSQPASPANTPPADNGEGNRFHFDIGLAYTSGISKLDSAIQNGYQANGFSYSSFYIPVGLKIDPYYLFNFGLGIGASIGPIAYEDVQNSDGYFVTVPLGIDARYVFINDSKLLPYVRVGARYPLAFGSLVSSPQIGAFGAVGVEYTPWHVGVEFSYDGSKLSAGYNGTTRKVEPNEFMVEVYIHI